jgi:hypothetical protein
MSLFNEGASGNGDNSANANEGGADNQNQDGQQNQSQDGQQNQNQDGQQNQNGENEGPSAFFGDDFDIKTVPEKYIKDGKVNVKAMTSSTNELEQHFHNTNEIIGKTPESYEVKFPEIEGVNEERLAEMIPKDDPMITAFGEVSKELGFTQGAHDKIMGKVVTALVKYDNDKMAEEKAALDDGVLETNVKFFKANLSEQGFKGIKEVMTTANAVKAVDELRKKMLDSTIPAGDGNENNVEDKLTEEGLRSIMKKPEYWNPRHPDYNSLRDKVEEGYKKLYDGKQG